MDRFPDIRGASLIALDTETKDPNLKALGPGAIRKDGYIVGISLATDEINVYLPIRHEEGVNLPVDQVTNYLRDMLSTDCPKIGANIPYDLEWLRSDLGVEVKGPKYDVQIAEWLLNEEKYTYTLDSLCVEYLGKHKTEHKLIEAAERLGIKETKIKENIWQMHVDDVEEYALADAKDALDIWKMQEPLIKEDGLENVFYNIEVPLIDVVLDMRFKGVPIDMDRAEQVRNDLNSAESNTRVRLKQLAGGLNIDVWSGQSIAKGAESLGLSYLRTEKGNPSFASDWLKAHEHDYFKAISKIRKLNRGGSVFVEKKIMECAYNGRVYPQFRQSKNDDGGTRSGRFASANPNMQQVPSRDDFLAPLIRSIFVAEPGCQWGKFDYKQQEPRMTVHYAFISNLIGSKEAHQRYIDNPETDYHTLVAEMAKIERPHAKTLNLGLSYGMGKKKVAIELDKPYPEAMRIYDQYHANVPFVKALSNKASNLAEARGFIRTISGRRKRFNLWGPKKYTKGVMPLSKKDAIVEYDPPIVRYFTYRAMNSLIQGSCADMTKLAMIDMYKAGYIPALSVHDEVDNPDIENMKQVKEINDIMINCMENNGFNMTVPLLVDVGLGPSWGALKDVKV